MSVEGDRRPRLKFEFAINHRCPACLSQHNFSTRSHKASRSPTSLLSHMPRADFSSHCVSSALASCHAFVPHRRTFAFHCCRSSWSNGPKEYVELSLRNLKKCCFSRRPSVRRCWKEYARVLITYSGSHLCSKGCRPRSCCLLVLVWTRTLTPGTCGIFFA